MIIGGYSLTENVGKFYGIDLLGTLYEEENFLSFGSGSPFSLDVLESEYDENMTKIILDSSQTIKSTNLDMH